MLFAARRDPVTPARWSAEDLPDLHGKVVIVTGANSGLGFATTKALARHGATVIMACRSTDKAEAAAQKIHAQVTGARLEVHRLDLADLSSVEAFVEAFCADHERLDVLCNNAGVMALPYRTTVDGFEMQFGTNHLGHFALTGRLLPMLLATEDARVVTVSSHMHRAGKIKFDDLQSKRRYSRWGAYGQSKLANLLFTLELQRRIDAAGRNLKSVSAHPGYASTELQTKGPKMDAASLLTRFYELANLVAGQSAAMGALPQLYAIGAPDVRGGEYFGPGGPFEMFGTPARVETSARARNEADARRLWDVSEELTGVRFDVL